MKYATVADIEARMNRELSESEESIADTLLGDAGIIIDTFNANASADA